MSIREFVGEELFNRMQKYGTMESWRLWIKEYVKSKVLMLELEELGAKYGIERKSQDYKHFLLKVKACEYLDKVYDFIKVQTEVKPPSTIGRVHKSYGKAPAVSEAQGAPAIDVYLTTVNGKRIWVEAETNIRNVEKDILKSGKYNNDYDEFYIIIPKNEYLSEFLHPFIAQKNSHFLLYDEYLDIVEEKQVI